MISVIIRSLNEQKYIGDCLAQISRQVTTHKVETILVDSGSSDGTVDIAKNFGCRLVHIKKEEFSFGRSLNVGCDMSSGEFLVFLSAHCIPTSDRWLDDLVSPLLSRVSGYSYGRQLWREGVSKYSEGCVFSKYYPSLSALPQNGFFCNNANAAIRRDLWTQYKFDEELTGLEDLQLAKQLVQAGEKISYVASASVEHIHEESWRQIRVRYEREAVALEKIAPELSVSFLDFLRLVVISIVSALSMAKNKSVSLFVEIILYRFNQYFGSFVGSIASKRRVKEMRKSYFYPSSDRNVVRLGVNNEDCSSIADEGK